MDLRPHITDLALFEHFLKNHTKRRLAESSIHEYKNAVKRFLASNPNLNDEESYMNFLIKTAYNKRCFQNVAAILLFIKYKFQDDRTVREHLINVVKEMRIKQAKAIKYRDKTPLTEEELNQVIGELEFEKHQIMSYIMFETGLRIGDMLRIPVGGIQKLKEKEEEVLRINVTTKGDDIRVVWIWNQDVANVIIDFINRIDYGTDYIFVEKKKMKLEYSEFRLRRINYHLYWNDLKQALIRSGIDRMRFAPHSFRRNYARRVWKKFNNMHTLQEMMGHRDVSTSIAYLREEGYDVSQSMRELQTGS